MTRRWRLCFSLCQTVRQSDILTFELVYRSVVAHCKVNRLADDQTLATVLLTLTLSTLTVGIAIVAVGEKDRYDSKRKAFCPPLPWNKSDSNSAARAVFNPYHL